MTLTNPRALSLSLISLAWVSVVAACGGSELEGRGQADSATTTDTTVTVEDGTDATVPTDAEPTTEADADATVTSPDVPDVIEPPCEWETLTLGDVGDITDGIAVDDDLAYATSGNRVLRWNGETWMTYGEPNGEDAIHGVWGDTSEVWVVGDKGFVARRKNGEDWEKIDIGLTGELAEKNLWDIDGRGPNDLWVVGDLGEVRRWDGTTWTRAFNSDTTNLRSLFVDRSKSGDNGIYAVGTGGWLVFNEDGTADADSDPDGFKITQSAASVTLTDVLVTPTGTIIVVGDDHTISAKRRVEDQTFRAQQTNDDRERDVAALAQAADGTIYAFGAEGLVLKQTGSTWVTVNEATPAAGLKNLAVAMVIPGPTTRILVLATEGNGVKLAGTGWSVFGSRPEAAVKDLESGPDGTVWAAGTLGTFLKRGPDGWTQLVLPKTVATKDLEAVTVLADGSAWAFGEGGTILKATTTTAPELIASPVPLDLFGAANDGTKIVACGRGGTLLEVENGVASVRASASISDLRAVAFGGDGALWIAGGFGTLLRATGIGAPLPVVSGVGGSLNDMTATSDGVLVVGDNGIVLDAKGTTATIVNESSGVFLQGVDVDGDTGFATGWNGVALREGAPSWVAETTCTNLILEAIWVGPDEALAAGRQGVLLRRLEAP